MQKATRFSLFIIGILFLFSSCGKDTGTTRYIPKDAIGVFSINTGKLTAKVGLNMLASNSVFSEMISEKGGDTTGFDFNKMGIDLLSTIHIYAVPDQRLGSRSRFMTLIGLKDAAKFQSFIKEKFPNARIESKGELTIAFLDKNACLGWDKHTAIAAASMPANRWEDPGTVATADPSSILAEEIQKAFALPREGSLADNDKFVKLQKDGHDFSVWMNYESLMGSLPQEQIGSAGAIMASQKKLLKDAFIAGGIDFEKGKITGDLTYYFNPSVKAIAEAMEPKSVNNDLLNRLPGNQLNLMLSYHFNPQGFKALADTIGMLPLATAGLKEVGLSLDDVLNAFSGDFLLAVTDFTVNTESQSYTLGGSPVNYTKPVPAFKASLSFKIKDRAAFDKLLNLTMKEGVVGQSAPNMYDVGHIASLSINGEYAIISNDPAVASGYLASSGNSKFDIPSEVKNNALGFYIDVKNSVQSLPLDLLYGKEDSTVFHDAKGLLESIRAYGGKVNGDHSDAHFEVRFQNKEENSLQQIIRFTQKVIEAEQKEGDSYDEVVPDEGSTEDAADTAAPI